MTQSTTVFGGFTTTMQATIASIAHASRKSREDTLPLHLEYINAPDGAYQKAMEVQFRVIWIAADTNVSVAEAECILNAGKGVNQIDKGAVMRSYRGFQHHLVRDDVTDEAVESSDDKGKKAAKADAPKATKAEAAAVAMFIQLVGSRRRALELLNSNGK